jgi:glycosyltransferase involved in cell wall biosynthesis
MNIWLIAQGEQLPAIDNTSRDYRFGILANVLLARGHQVVRWTSTFNHIAKKNRFPNSRTVAIQPGFEIRFLYGPGYPKNTSSKRFFHNRATAQAFRAEYLDTPDKPDVILCGLPTLELAEQAILVGKRLQIPVIIDIWDLWPDFYLTLFPRPLRGLARLMLTSEFNRMYKICQQATSITAVSNSYLNWALQYAKRKKEEHDKVFPLGYPLLPEPQEETVALTTEHLKKQHAIDEEKFVVTFLGSFGFTYDLETVIMAAKILEQEHPGATQFILAGDGDKTQKLYQMARGVQNVVFTGWLDQTSIQGLLHISTIGLAPYKKEAPQSLPLKPFEYMAHRLPLLSSLQSELETLIREERIGLQYQAEQADSLAEAVRWCFAHPADLQAMANRSLALFKERFSEEIVYSGLAKYLEDIVYAWKS